MRGCVCTVLYTYVDTEEALLVKMNLCSVPSVVQRILVNSDFNSVFLIFFLPRNDFPSSSFRLCRAQSGVLRTNCTDCLDRTNGAQTAFALDALAAQVASLDIGDVSPSVAYRLTETFKVRSTQLLSIQLID